MQLNNAFGILGRNDSKLIRRDSFLVTMVFYILVFAVILRFALPPLQEALLSDSDLDIRPFYPMIAAFFAIVMGGIVSGMLFGFLILDERDDRTLKAMLVTPLPLSWYMLYRVGVAMMMNVLMFLAVALIVNVALPPLPALMVIAAAAALVAPVVMLFFAVFAENKVQGFALLKIASSSGILIMVAYFVQEPLQWLFGLYPPYWIAKAYWEANANNPMWPLFALVGFVYMAGLLWVAVQRFQVVMYRD